jgi:hypothetical protein
VRTIIATLAGLTVLAAVSAQAAPLAAAKASPAEAATPPIELVRQGWAGIEAIGGTARATGMGVAATRISDFARADGVRGLTLISRMYDGGARRWTSRRPV